MDNSGCLNAGIVNSELAQRLFYGCSHTNTQEKKSRVCVVVLLLTSQQWRSKGTLAKNKCKRCDEVMTVKINRTARPVIYRPGRYNIYLYNLHIRIVFCLCKGVFYKPTLNETGFADAVCSLFSLSVGTSRVLLNVQAAELLCCRF